MSAITLVSAGGIFVAATLAGFAAGLGMSHLSGQGFWIPLLVLAGVALGGGLALRQLLRVR